MKRLVLFLVSLILLIETSIPGSAQVDKKITPTASAGPSVLPVNQVSNLFLGVTNANPNSTGSISKGDAFSFAFDSASGSSFAISGAVFVNSVTMTAADFAATFDAGLREFTITYNGGGAPFVPGDSFGVKISF